MKGILWLLLLPNLAIAQQPLTNAKAPSQEAFDGLKSKLTQSLQSSQTAMEQAKICLTGAQDQRKFDECFNQMPDAMKRELQTTVSPTQPLTYSDDSRQRSIETLESWIQSFQNIVGCFDAAPNVEQLKSCFGTGSSTVSTNIDSSTNRVPLSGDSTNTQLSDDW
jgi:hypothetical protein